MKSLALQLTRIRVSEQDLENITNEIEKRITKPIRDAEFGQRENLILIENLHSKVDNHSNASSQQGYSTVRIEPNEIVTRELEGTYSA